MLITECVTSQREACYSWLQKLIDTSLLDGERELAHQKAGFLFCISVHESSRTGVIRVSLLKLY